MKSHVVTLCAFLLVAASLWIPAGDVSAVNACVTDRSIGQSSCVFDFNACVGSGLPCPFIFSLCTSNVMMSFQSCSAQPEVDPLAAYNECWNGCQSDYQFCVANGQSGCDCIGAKLECTSTCLGLFPDDRF